MNSRTASPTSSHTTTREDTRCLTILAGTDCCDCISGPLRPAQVEQVDDQQLALGRPPPRFPGGHVALAAALQGLLDGFERGAIEPVVVGEVGGARFREALAVR